MPSSGVKHATRSYLRRFWHTVVEMSGVSPAPQEPESFVRPAEDFDDFDSQPEYHRRPPADADRGMMRHGKLVLLQVPLPSLTQRLLSLSQDSHLSRRRRSLPCRWSAWTARRCSRRRRHP